MGEFLEWATSRWRMYRWDIVGGFFLAAVLAVASWAAK